MIFSKYYIAAWEKLEIESKLPLPEVITLCGFFFVCIMEEVLHHFLQPHEPTTDCDTFMDTHRSTSSQKGEGKLKSWVDSTLKRKSYPLLTKEITNGNGIHLDEFKRYDSRYRNGSQHPSTDPPSDSYKSSDQSHDVGEYTSKNSHAMHFHERK